MTRFFNHSIVFLLLLLLLALSGCVTTPESGRSAFILVPEAVEESIGLKAFEQVMAKERISTNPRWTEILNRVGRRIAAVTNKPEYKWEFKLIESSQKNAFCLPGGKVAFYTGIFPLAQNEAGLATIMGHEVAHAVARHAGQRMTVALGTNLGLAALSEILNDKSSQSRQILLAALGIGTQIGVMLPFSRSNESEADQIGLIYMAKAGYDPAEAPRVWGRFAAESGGKMPVFLSTHPESEGRMHALDAQLPNVQGYYNHATVKYGRGETL